MGSLTQCSTSVSQEPVFPILATGCSEIGVSQELVIKLTALPVMLSLIRLKQGESDMIHYLSLVRKEQNTTLEARKTGGQYVAQDTIIVCTTSAS